MKIAKKIIFIGGIHGVGKGHICKQISSKYKIKHYSASKIIKWGEMSKLSNKTVENIDYTQERLINGLAELIKDDENYILDGHFCLLNNDNKPERVNFSTFEQINPKILAVIIEDIEMILNRLSNRDDTKYSFELLEKMQKMEIEYATKVSEKLKIPLIKIYNQEYSPLIKHLQR